MHRKIHIYRRRNRVQALARFLLVMGLVCLLFMIGMIASPATTHADGIPGGNISDPSVRVVDIAKPAVVRIITFLNGHLTVHFSATQNVTFPQGGGTGSGYGLAALGTGTFISAHGDILTADHVVRPPQGQELTTVLIKAAAPDVTAYYNLHIKPANQVTADQMVQLLSNNQIPSDATFDPPLSRAYLSTDYTGPLTATQLKDVPPQVYAPVDRIEQESAVNQSDVALIHVNMNDTASVQLGDSSAVQQQDNLTIIGFPGNGDISNNPTGLLTSSINRIFVSSMKTTDTGSQVIQVGGNVEQGDSGGPALDSQGRVVGIVSFGAPGGTSFLQASNSAKQLVQAQHLDTTPGAFQVAWNQAFNDYASTAPGHWHKAQQEFTSLATRYPTFKAIIPYQNYAATQAQHEQTPATQPQSSNQPTASAAIPWPLIGAGLVILVLLLFGVGMARGRRKARVQASGAAGASALPMAGPFATAHPASMQQPPASFPQRVPVPHHQ
ncbi:MAG: trypsin-like peptidase domain-containing protein, partial [Ktedonobacteraceae bacterium]|nr:trypsin-like peptidase domain-containing protein [Ktedonobacteraceae bacterium]